MGILDGYMPDMSTPYYTQDYVPVKNIYGGVIQTKDDRFLRIVEVLPVNFASKSWQEKDDIISEFGGWLSIAPVNIQIKIITDDSDPQKIINKVLDRVKADGDTNVEAHARHYTELLQSLGGGGAISRRFFMIVSYEPKASSKKNPSVEDIVLELNNTINSIATYFDRMGNVIIPLSETGQEKDEEFAVMDFLYKLYNPRSSKSEPGKSAVSLQQRMERIFKDKRKINNDPKALVGIDDVIAPMSINITNKDCLLIDGLYHSYMLVSGDAYPMRTVAGWFPAVFSLGPGEMVDIYIHKESRSQFLKKISTNIRLTSVKLEEKNKTQSDYEKTEIALDSATYIKEAMNQSGEDPFFITTMITLTGYTREDLIKRKEYLIESFASRDMVLNPLTNIQEESMRSSLPFLDLSPKIYEKGKRNIMSSGLASCYPFISADMNDEGGILMGLDMINNSMCILNPFNKKAYPNANMVILGSSGMGKTFLEQLMALRTRTAMGAQCFILAPDKAHEFQRACSAGVQGEFIKIAASSRDHINIMDIHPTVSETALLLQGEAAENTILVSEQANAIITFISLLIDDLTNAEEQTIDTCIIRTYAKYGITEDNESVYIDPRHKEKGLKEMPVLGDLYNELQKTDISERILMILSQFITGSAKSFNNRTNVDLSNKYIVFDLSSLSGRLLPAGMFVVLNTIVNRIKEDVTERKMVFIDEGWRLIGGGANEKAAEYVKWLFKIIRGYNGGACIATQDIDDFFSLNDGEYGNAILANSQMKMLLKLSPKEVEYVQKEVKLTTAERRAINKYTRGQCLICANANHIPVNILASDYERKLITTDPDEVKAVLAEMKANGGKLL